MSGFELRHDDSSGCKILSADPRQRGDGDLVVRRSTRDAPRKDVSQLAGYPVGGVHSQADCPGHFAVADGSRDQIDKDLRAQQSQRVPEAGSHEALLYCYSPARAEKDRAIDTKKADFFEAELTKLAAGLTKPRATKDPGKIRERIGRAREKHARAAQHYTVDVALDETGKIVTAITWKKAPKANSSMANPGVYCLRTTLTEPDDATLWRIYSMLTNLEAVFRSLKTDLGIRPMYHRIDRRVEGHLFISLLAYCVVHAMRLRLKAKGIKDSWETIRNTLSNHVRVTTNHLRDPARIEAAET